MEKIFTERLLTIQHLVFAEACLDLRYKIIVSCYLIRLRQHVLSAFAESWVFNNDVRRAIPLVTLGQCIDELRLVH